MSEIGSVSNRTHGLPTQVEQSRNDAGRGRDALPVTDEPVDRVEISDAAARYDTRADADEAMGHRIAEIRAAIEADTYVTPDKIDVVVERLYAELTAERNATAKA